MIKTASRNAQSNAGVLLDEASPEHVCATCVHKQRLVISAAGGKKIAVVWKCRELSKRFFKEVRIEASGSCYAANSLTDYWSLTPETDLVW